MNLRDRLARIEARARRTAERGNERHYAIDERFDIIEANTERISDLEIRLAELAAQIADHAALKTGKAHK